MGISNLADVERAIQTAKTYFIQKGLTISTCSSGWRYSSIPVIGALPTTATVCDGNTLGAIGPILNAPVGQFNYLVESTTLTTTTARVSALVSDRLVHMGSLSGIVTTPQDVLVDASQTVLDGRRGSADYSDLEWWVEWYVATGATTTTATLAVTYADGSTGNVLITVPATAAIARLIQIIPDPGKYIKSIQTLTLTATTGTAGNFGVTVSRPITQATPLVNEMTVNNWTKTGLQRIPADCCLWTFAYSSSSALTLYLTLRIASM